jgi:hypothetical protein
MRTCLKALGVGLWVALLLLLGAVKGRTDSNAALDAFCRAHHFDRACDASTGCGWLDHRVDACQVTGFVNDPAQWAQHIWFSTAVVLSSDVPDYELEALNQQRTWCNKL